MLSRSATTVALHIPAAQPVRRPLKWKESIMSFLDGLLGGGQKHTEAEFRDFVSRYEQGDPAEGYSDDEVLSRYGAVAHDVPRDQYAQAAQDAMARLSPEDRASLAKTLQQRAQSRGVPLPREIGTSPNDLGGLLTDLHQTPGRLRDLLGSGASGGARSPASESGVSSMLSSPVAKATLSGTAAMVVKRYMGR
jgi:hypothetical protein